MLIVLRKQLRNQTRKKIKRCICARGTYYIRAQERFCKLLSKCKNKYSCLGVAYNERYSKPWSARIFNKLIGRYKTKEQAIIKRMMANKKHGLTGEHLIDSLVILRDIFATEEPTINYTLQSNSNYYALCKRDAIKNACRVDPTKEYSNINKIIESLGY